MSPSIGPARGPALYLSSAAIVGPRIVVAGATAPGLPRYLQAACHRAFDCRESRAERGTADKHARAVRLRGRAEHGEIACASHTTDASAGAFSMRVRSGAVACSRPCNAMRRGVAGFRCDRVACRTARLNRARPAGST
ncbi:hypothetical protein DB771_24870 [Burkholderia sp. AU29985]|nr:hypothetical protein XM57_11625 [Burkholderia cepacia]AYZ98299.1 hypothetical protein EGY28_25705 [Burkholderia dolosa]ETP66830.1 hypothetical protein BDSB_08315 [Burkholderia dolosa PC543]PRE47552.1 hypothetical protein C6P87_17980 [Burkholderia sp. AU12872]PUA74279.1 hypothetical protein DB771_24870 [Burkholderia sp. AU29985]